MSEWESLMEFAALDPERFWQVLLLLLSALCASSAAVLLVVQTVLACRGDDR